MKDHKHVQLDGGAMASVDPGCAPETMNALNEMVKRVRAAAERGELPESEGEWDEGLSAEWAGFFDSLQREVARLRYNCDPEILTAALWLEADLQMLRERIESLFRVENKEDLP